jgi:DNA-binding NtrC family response regulator
MGLKEIRILIVDDEQDLLDTMSKRMRKRGMIVHASSNGLDALELIQKEPIDVVLLDVRMPQMNGIDVLKRIKEIDPMMAVVMLTGHASIESAVTGMEYGAFDYLIKPVDFDSLCYMIEDAYQEKLLKEKKRSASVTSD